MRAQGKQFLQQNKQNKLKPKKKQVLFLCLVKAEQMVVCFCKSSTAAAYSRFNLDGFIGLHNDKGFQKLKKTKIQVRIFQTSTWDCKYTSFRQLHRIA